VLTPLQRLPRRRSRLYRLPCLSTSRRMSRPTIERRPAQRDLHRRETAPALWPTFSSSCAQLLPHVVTEAPVIEDRRAIGLRHQAAAVTPCYDPSRKLRYSRIVSQYKDGALPDLRQSIWWRQDLWVNF